MILYHCYLSIMERMNNRVWILSTLAYKFYIAFGDRQFKMQPWVVKKMQIKSTVFAADTNVYTNYDICYC